MKIDIAKVLAMDEDEQQYYLAENDIIHNKSDGDGKYTVYESLADLAFRLRDEAVEKNCTAYHIAFEEIRKIWIMTAGPNGTYYLDRFVMYDAQPIHWILAALKALEESKGATK